MHTLTHSSNLLCLNSLVAIKRGSTATPSGTAMVSAAPENSLKDAPKGRLSKKAKACVFQSEDAVPISSSREK